MATEGRVAEPAALNKETGTCSFAGKEMLPSVRDWGRRGTAAIEIPHDVGDSHLLSSV